MKSVIVLDLDETLEHGVIDDKTGKTNMILRPNLDVLINKLKEVKKKNIDVILCTTARNEWVEKFLVQKPECRTIFDKIYTRDNEDIWKNFCKEKYPLEYKAKDENINLEYSKPITTFGYDSILFIEDNRTEYARLDILFKLTEGKLKKDVTFYNVEKYLGDANKEDFECINMTKAIAFFEKKDFKIGLTYIDKNYSTI